MNERPKTFVPLTTALPWPQRAPTAALAVDREPKRLSKVLRPVLPNAGLRMLYQRRLEALIREMNDSVIYWVRASYRANEPKVAILAADELPSQALLRAVKVLSKRWLKRFDAAAPKLAEWFATAAKDRSDAVLRKILREGGFSVKWKMTQSMKDVMAATVGEQVGLIRSIPQQYFTQIEGMVMRSVTIGRDVGGLAKDIEKQYGVTRRRAQFIAQDQNNKASATMVRTRHLELGLTLAVWRHSGGGKEPRPTHVANSGKTYSISEGWFDPAVGKYIQPGELPRCRCYARPVVKGFS
jgi:hypothetical protein